MAATILHKILAAAGIAGFTMAATLPTAVQAIGKPAASACNPCPNACNPCAASACNPCAAAACNPCAAVTASACNPCNPCAAAKPCA